MTKLKLKDKALGMKIWKWYILLAVWTLMPLIHVIRGEMGKAFNLAMWMLVGVLTGRAFWEINMIIKKRKCKRLINGYYTGRSTHEDGTVMYTRIPIVMPERSFDFRVKSARGPEEIANLLIENLQEMYRLEPHLALFLKSWVDDGTHPPWASKEEIKRIDELRVTERAERIIKKVKDEKINGSLENEKSPI